MMQIDVKQNLALLKQKINLAVSKRTSDVSSIVPRVVAVSKTKPKELIIEAYIAGQRDFGENYVHEIVEKGNSDVILSNCPDIKWHFIGHLQRNKVNKLLTVPNLSVIETVDSFKLASAIDQAWSRLYPAKDSLNVFLQVNTSGEADKSGCKPEEAPGLGAQIQQQCSRLNLLGLMTIGKYDNYEAHAEINPDFRTLLECRAAVASAVGKPACELELSMGMSADFEHAVELGSTNVRVGQGVFGVRDYSK